MHDIVSFQASELLAQEVNATQKRSLGKETAEIFACFARKDGYAGHWTWSNRSTTLRAVESFAKRGLAVVSTEQVGDRTITRYKLRPDLRARLMELESEVQAQRKADDAERQAERERVNAHRRFVVIIVDSTGIPSRYGSILSGLSGQEAARQLVKHWKTTPAAQEGGTATIVEMAPAR